MAATKAAPTSSKAAKPPAKAAAGAAPTSRAKPSPKKGGKAGKGK